MTPPPRTRAGIYCRISLDLEGEAMGVQRQEEDCRLLAEQRGWDVAGVYVDNSVSAFKRNTKRPEFERLLTDLERGALDALVVYDLDRYTRQPRDLERLIDIFETRKTLSFAAVTGDIDLSSDNGVMMARFAVNIANKSSKDTGRRVARKHLQLAQMGVPVGGTRPFGYLDDLRTPHPTEAPLVREAVDALLEGKTDLTKVTREWNAAGLTSTRGGRLQRQTVKQLLKNPRLAGWRTHNGAIALDAAGKPVRGQWEAIVDAEAFDRLQTLLSDARGVTGARPGKRRYLLASIARCGECSMLLQGNAQTYKIDDATGEKVVSNYYYRCPAPTHGGCGKVGISGPKTDAMVADLVRAKLSGVKSTKSTGWPKAEELADKQARVTELMTAYTGGSLTGSVVFPAVEALEREIASLRTQEQTWTRQHRQQTPASVEQWDDLNIDMRRALIGSVIQAVVVRPAAGRGGQYDPSRVSVVWRA